jgi:acrylyl-CoA reductase (NADPH)
MEVRAYRIQKEGLNQGQLVTLPLEQLSEGNVVIEARYSSLNYKDALAVTGQGRILRKFPLNAGIDVAGLVLRSADPRFQTGDPVLVTGCGLGESQDGGFASHVQVPGDWIVPLPSGMSLREAMIYGTAGFTAGLCVHRLLVNDQTPDKGPMVVTGASGGVGSLAVAMLSKLGFEVIAVSSKTSSVDFLKGLGARQVTKPEELALGKRPLESVRFGGVVDNVGGTLLEGLLRHVQLWGNVASIGLAGGAELQATVMPFILRGVSLLGISSANCPMPLRREIWSQLSGALRPSNLETFVHQEIPLEGLAQASQDMLARKTEGRSLVAIRQL